MILWRTPRQQKKNWSQYPGQFVGYEVPVEIQKEELKKELDQEFSTPLSIRSIKLFEDNIDFIKSDTTIHRKFLDTVTYLISIGGAESSRTNIPSRALYQLSSSPALMGLLPKDMKESLVGLVEKERFKLEKIEPDSDKWNTSEIVSAMNLYKHYDKKSFGKDKKLEANFKSIQEGLIKKARQWAHRHLINQQGIEQVELNTTEKLLLLEMRNLFGDNALGASEIDINLNTTQVLNEIAKSENNSDIFLVWEIADNLLHDIMTLEPETKKRIQGFIYQANASQVLQALENEKVLLPIHLKALKEIEKLPHFGDIQIKINNAFLEKGETSQEEGDSRKKTTSGSANIDYQRHQSEYSQLLDKKEKLLVDGVRCIEPGNQTGEYAPISDAGKAMIQKAREEGVDSLSAMLEDFQFSPEDESRLQIGKQIQDKQAEINESKIRAHKESGYYAHEAQNVEYASNAKTKAKNIQEQYLRSLEDRIMKHELHSADLLVLWDDQTNKIKKTEKGREVTKIREKIYEIFSRVLNNTNPPQIQRDIDAYMPFIRKIQSLIQDPSITQEIQKFVPSKTVMTSEILHASMMTAVQDILNQKLAHIPIDQRVQIFSKLRMHSKISPWQNRIKVDEIYKKYNNQYARLSEEIGAKELKLKSAIRNIYPEDPESIMARLWGKDVPTFFDSNSDELQEILEKDENIEFSSRKKNSINNLIRHISFSNLNNEQQDEENFIRQNIDQYLRPPQTSEEQKAYKSLIEQIKLIRSFYVTTSQYYDGWKTPDGTVYPGEKQIIEAKRDMSAGCETLKQALKEFGIRIKLTIENKNQFSDDETRQQHVMSVIQELKDYNIVNIIQSLQVLMQSIFYDPSYQEFLKSYWAEVWERYSTLISVIDMYENLDQEDLSLLNKAKTELFSILEFNKNDSKFYWETPQKNVDQLLENQGEVIMTLKNDIHFFDFESSVSPANQFEQETNIRQIEFEKYKQTIFNIYSQGREDAQKYADQFFDIYGMEISTFEEKMNTNLKDIENINEAWSQYYLNGKGSIFFNEWMKKYHSSPSGRSTALEQIYQWDNLRTEIKNMEPLTENMQKWLEKRKEINLDSSSIRDYFAGGQKISISAIFEVIKGYFEHRDEIVKRNSDAAKATLGIAVFGETTLGNIYRQKGEEGEQERVKAYETAWHDQNPWAIREQLYRSDNSDEVRAIIGLLIEKGFMQWDDPLFLLTLNRLQTNINFSKEDTNKTVTDLLVKIRSAANSIWSVKVFQEFEGMFQPKLDSAMGEFDADFLRLRNETNGHHSVLGKMLRDWQEGNEVEGQVNPARFESFIRNAIKEGWMNGLPDSRFYYLIMGITTKNKKTGTTLISKDALKRLSLDSNFMARLPVVEFFTDGDSYKKDGYVVPKGTPGAEIRGWDQNDFEVWAQMMQGGNQAFDFNSPVTQKASENWFYEVMLMSDTTSDRVQRMSRGGSGQFDHDDANLYFSTLRLDSVVQMLVKESGGAEKSTPDFWRNLIHESDRYFRQIKRVIDKFDNKYGDHDGWLEKRESLLKDAGSRMRMAMTVIQTLQGNTDLGGQDRNQNFTKDDWNKSSQYSKNANASREKIKEINTMIFKKKGKYDDFEDLFQRSVIEETGKSATKKDSISNRVSSIVKGATGDNIYGDTQAVWETLLEYDNTPLISDTVDNSPPPKDKNEPLAA